MMFRGEAPCLDQINAGNLSEVAFRSGPQTFIQSCQKDSPVSN